MKKSAIIAALWERNNDVLLQFAAAHPDVTIFLPSTSATQELLKILTENGIETFILEGFLTPDETKAADDLIAKTNLDAATLKDSEEWTGFCKQWSFPVTNLTNTVLDNFKIYSTGAIHFLSVLEKIRALYDLQLAVVNEDVTTTSKTLCLWAKAHGIPSLLVAHGTLISKAYTVHKGLFADVAAVFSERGTESYAEIGVSADRMIVTGNPAWDHYPKLIQQRGQVKELLFKKYHLTDLPLITFGTIWGHYFSGLVDESIYGNTLGAFMKALGTLQQQGLKFQAVVKDRAENSSFGQQRFNQLLIENNLNPTLVHHATEDAEAFVISSDLLVAIDSNLCIEAMMAEVPAINLLNSTGLTLGPSFDADSGVLEVEGEELAGALSALLTNEQLRKKCVERSQSALNRYSFGRDGKCAERAAQLMAKMLRSSENKYIWQQYLDVEELEVSQYHEVPRTHLVDMFAHAPRVALDIGCGAGATLRLIKERYPESKAIGIELSRSAANAAKQIADQVLVGAFDDFNFPEHGIGLGSIDTVILADVLEHMYNPWSTMVKLKPYLSADAQVIISIPNVRNLALMEDLCKGYWHYDSAGLLDITHVRFFTLKEFNRFVRETGYQRHDLIFGLDGRLIEFHNQHQSDHPIDLDFDRFTLKKVDSTELMELCSLQFYMRVSPAPLGAILQNDDNEDLQRKSVVTATAPDSSIPEYVAWLASRRISKIEGEQFDARIASWKVKPAFYIVVNALGVTENQLIRTLKSLGTQYFEVKRIVVVSDQSCPIGLELSDRFHWKTLAQDATWVNAVNDLLEFEFESDTASWVSVIPAGDSLEPHALLLIAEGAYTNAEWRFIYVDEDSLEGDDKLSSPIFKPDFNLELLLSYPYLGDAVFIRADAFIELKGLRELTGVERHDFALRVIAKYGSSVIGHRPYMLHHRDVTRNSATVGEVVENATVALQHHFDSQDIAANILPGIFPGSFHIDYQYEDIPGISILIAVGSQLVALQECLESLMTKVSSANFEIIVLATETDNPELNTYLNGLESLGNDLIRVLHHSGGGSLGSLHNILASQARGEYLLFLHHDSIALSENWAGELLQLCRRPDVVAAAPRRLLADGTVCTGGVVLGLDGVGVSPFANFKHDNSGYMNRAHLVQEFSALAAGCLMVELQSFLAVDGFDETLVDDATSTIELCTRLRAAGGKLIWTPHVNVMTRDTATKSEWIGVNPSEADREVVRLASRESVFEKSISSFAHDPAYSPNLSLTVGPFAIEDRREFNWKVLEWHPLKRILTYYADNMGCGHYRMLAPTREINLSGKAQVWSGGIFPSPSELAGLEVDSLIFQRPVMHYQLEHLARCRKFGDAFVVFEIDDLITNLPGKSIHAKDIPKDIGSSLRKSLTHCHRFVVSTEYLKHAYRDLHEDIVVVPNYIEHGMWKDLTSLRRASAKPRVGWVGGVGHAGDLELIADVVKELALDLALAPLEMHPFNEGKSHLRLLEYGILGLPVICTDILPYQGDYPVTRIRNSTENWVKAIREHISDMDELAKRGDILRQYIIDNWLLHDHLDEWVAAWTRS
ncbi:MAG: methyltransferase domain-containing protein [Betaproteobacteria bacterium]|nr:methyltransferase domain-containing protein [Betaproteobacteria bacterium]